MVGRLTHHDVTAVDDTIDDGTQFWGFNVNAATARGDGGRPGWFFVLEQQATAPRFGLDAGKVGAGKPAPADSDDWSWAHVSLDESGVHADLDAAPFKGMTSAKVAQGTYQRPVRMFAHARTMLPD